MAKYIEKLEIAILSDVFATVASEILNSLLPQDDATAKTTLENNDLINWIGKNNRAARAARTLVQFFGADC